MLCSNERFLINILRMQEFLILKLHLKARGERVAHRTRSATTSPQSDMSTVNEPGAVHLVQTRLRHLHLTIPDQLCHKAITQLTNANALNQTMSDESRRKPSVGESSLGAVRASTGLADALDLEAERGEPLCVDYITAVEYQAWSAHD